VICWKINYDDILVFKKERELPPGTSPPANLKQPTKEIE
jgi:hypothetical protein